MPLFNPRTSFVFVSAVAAATVALSPIPVVIDTDIGSDFDDMWALTYILSRPELFDLKLVQASTFNTTARATLVAKVLDVLNRTDVPVAVGAYTGEDDCSQCAWASDYSLNDFVAKGGNVTYGVDYLQQLMSTATAENPLYIVEIAPATSLGTVLAENMNVARNCVVVAMSGSIDYGYLNATGATPEYNVRTDVHASQLMYSAPWLAPLLIAPLDSTNFAQFMGAVYETLLAANSSNYLFASTLLENYQIWYTNMNNSPWYQGIIPYSPFNATSTLFDVQAAWMLPYYAIAIQHAMADVASSDTSVLSSSLLRQQKSGTKSVSSCKSAMTLIPVNNTIPLLNIIQMDVGVNASGFTINTPSNGNVAWIAESWKNENPYLETGVMGLEIIDSIVRAH